jgi:hypothetical protein
MVDVVPNHFAHAGGVEGIKYDEFGAPFDKKGAFHKHCWITDYDDQEMVENVCMLPGMCPRRRLMGPGSAGWVTRGLRSWMSIPRYRGCKKP